MIPDRIEKKVQLRASLERVWQAVSDSAQLVVGSASNLTGPSRPARGSSGVSSPQKSIRKSQSCRSLAGAWLSSSVSIRSSR